MVSCFLAKMDKLTVGIASLFARSCVAALLGGAAWPSVAMVMYPPDTVGDEGSTTVWSYAAAFAGEAAWPYYVQRHTLGYVYRHTTCHAIP